MNVKAGDLLLTEKPFGFVLNPEDRKNHCDHCFAERELKKCSACHYVGYCGRECQVEAWGYHMWECKNFKRLQSIVLSNVAWLLARIINRLARGEGQTFRSFYGDTKFRMWKDLMSHYSDVKADSSKMEEILSLRGPLSVFLHDLSLPHSIELINLYGKVLVNSFTIQNTDMTSLGTGLYLAASIFDHSCNPNAVITFEGTTINLRALYDMTNLDWNQIKISYIDLLYTPYDRQTVLLNGYYFLCECEKCLDVTQHRTCHAAKCLNRECRNTVTIPQSNRQIVLTVANSEQTKEAAASEKQAESDGISCDACGTKFEKKNVEDFMRAMDLAEGHLKDMKKTRVSFGNICQYCISQQGTLHPLNVLRAQTLENVFEAYMMVNLWEDAIEIAELLLPCYKFYYGERHPVVGLLHLKYGKLLMQDEATGDAIQQFKCAMKILKITHGEKHPLYKDQLMPLYMDAMIAELQLD